MTTALHQSAIKPFMQPSLREFSTRVAEERVILVNRQNEVIGTEGKTRTHLLGLLHRAFSIFIINSAGQLLVQKRAATKYHSRNLWSNTCCGHPRPSETVAQASRRRLREEMGFESNLKEVFSFLYRANLEDGLIENEYDHVLVGRFENSPEPNPTEISDWKWIDVASLRVDLRRNPESYTYWFRISFDHSVRVFQTI